MQRRSRGRIVVDTYVKVDMSNWTDLLTDMGIVGPNGDPLKMVWMYGHVKCVKPNHFEVRLPAAEQQYDCIKSKVEEVKDGDGECLDFYVVMDDKKTIKKLQGLRLTPGFFAADYFESVEQAQEIYAEAVLAQPRKSVVASSAAAITVTTVVTTFPRTQVIMLFVIYDTKIIFLCRFRTQTRRLRRKVMSLTMSLTRPSPKNRTYRTQLTLMHGI